MKKFKLQAPFTPKGDQGEAIQALSQGLAKGLPYQTLLGVTGSGKTYTIAKVIERANRPTLVISHNKTLAAQLYQEFRSFFPDNAVEYFVSYYDYYQPEAYIPQTDTYIEKDASINDEIDKLRLRATKSLFERRDCIIVASVSCIYGIGSPDIYYQMLYFLETQKEKPLDEVLKALVAMQYERTPYDLYRGAFRLRGDTLEIFPAYEDHALRVEFWGDEIIGLHRIDPLRGTTLESLEKVAIYPKSHYVTPRDRLLLAIQNIKEELRERLKELREQNRLVEAQRLEQRTLYDLSMLEEMGYCKGIENYSRHLSGRLPGEPPYTLLDYFPRDFLCIIDESHQTIPQLQGMAQGDRSRKKNLIDFGFRLPSALDNRPLTFEEFEQRVHQVIFVSATPGPYELEKSKGAVVEQLIRPTGILDPEMEVRPTKGQVDDLLGLIQERVARKERVLVTTLTKRMAEDLTEHFLELGVACRYLHSEIDTLERIALLKDFRDGVFDVLIGINLLREGLDLPEVSCVAILDADKEGFLRSTTAIIQTAGRAARNVHGKVVLYADRITPAIQAALQETQRRREKQRAYNEAHQIKPETIIKDVKSHLVQLSNLDYYDPQRVMLRVAESLETVDLHKEIRFLERKMKEAAKAWEFEKAAEIRDRIKELKSLLVFA